MRAKTLGSAALIALTFSAWGEASGQDPIPFRLARGRLPIVPVRVDGHGPYGFLLDTGTTSTVVDAELAGTLGLRVASRSRVGTPAGERVFHRAERTPISVAGNVRPLSPLVADLEELKRIDRGIRGVLGLDWLSSFNILIDYEKRRLTLDERPVDTPLSRVPYRLSGKRILVPVGAGGGGDHPAWLVLDTGAEGVVLFEPSPLAVARDARNLVRLSSAGGTALLRTGRIDNLQVGSVLLRNVPVTLLPQTSALAGSAGLLPGRLFRRLYVNHREGYVVFDSNL